MYRDDATGFYEADFRRPWLKGGRWHVSYGVKRERDAKLLDEAAQRLVRERREQLIDLIRRRKRSIHEVAAAIADGRSMESLVEESKATELAWPTLGQAAADYIEWIEKNERKADRTADAAEAQLATFLEFAGADTPVHLITSTRVIEYQRYLYEQEYAQNTVTSRVWRVSGLYTWLNRREKKEARDAGRPARAIEIPIDPDEVTTKKTRRERSLLEHEAELLIAATPEALLFPLLCGLLAGLRIDETVHLRPGFDVDTRLWLFTIQEQPTWHPKNRKRRVVPIAPQLRPVVEHHLRKYASAHWMLPSSMYDEQPIASKTLLRHFKQIVKDAELVSGREDPRGVVYHTLRHTFASWLVMKGVDLYTVSQLLGNSLKQVEQTYAHLAPNFRQRAVEALKGIVEIPDLSQETQEPANA